MLEYYVIRFVAIFVATYSGILLFYVFYLIKKFPEDHYYNKNDSEYFKSVLKNSRFLLPTLILIEIILGLWCYGGEISSNSPPMPLFIGVVFLTVIECAITLFMVTGVYINKLYKKIQKNWISTRMDIIK